MAKSSRLSSAALVVGNGVLMLCALVGLLLSFLSLYPVSAEAAALLPQTVIFALTSLAVWSLPRYSGRAVGGCAALWAFNVFLNWQKAVQGALLVFSQCLKFAAEGMGYVPLFRYEPPVGVSRKEVSVVFLTPALTLLAWLLGLAVVRLRCWWLTVLLTLPPLVPALLTFTLPQWPPLLALAVCWCAMLFAALCRKTEGRGWLILAALTASAALLTAVTALFPREDYTRPQWALDTEQAIVDFGNRWLEFMREWDGPFHNYGEPPPPSPAAPVDLSDSGPLEFSGRPVLRMRASASGHYYLRGTSMDIYTGDAWAPFPDGVWEEYTSALPEDGWTGSPLLFLGYASPFGEYSAVVDNVDHDSRTAFLPYQVVPQDWEATGAFPVRDQGFRAAENAWGFPVALTGYDRDLSALTSWPEEHGGALSPLTGAAAQAEGIYRDYVYAHYLDVPDSAWHAIHDALEPKYVFPAHIPPAEAAEAIRDLLDDRCVYDLDTPAPPGGEDYVTWFLNSSRRGYCMHFATAATLMFRMLGVPARYVSGYTVDVPADVPVTVRDSAAHAWVEIYLDGWGWYPVEVTPGFSDEFDLEQLEQSGDDPEPVSSLPPEQTEPPQPTATPRPSREPVSPAPTPEAEDAPGSPIRQNALAVLRVLAMILGPLAAVAVLLWSIQFILKRLRRRRLTDGDANRAVLNGYRCLNRMRPWGGKVPPEATALAEKAMYGGRPLTGEERRAMLELYNGQRQRLWMRLYGWRRLTFLYLWGRPKRT